VVIRELIHAFDDCRAANLDWSDCAQSACSEVRILQCVPVGICWFFKTFYPSNWYFFMILWNRYELII